MTGLISVVVIIAIALIVTVVTIIRAYVVPPLEAEPTGAGLRVQINRAVLRDLEFSINGGPFVTVADLTQGETVLPWSKFGLSDSAIAHTSVRQVQARGLSRFCRFETTLSFGKADSATFTSQTLNYVGSAAGD